jgi:hypothetical protein
MSSDSEKWMLYDLVTTGIGARMASLKAKVRELGESSSAAAIEAQAEIERLAAQKESLSELDLPALQEVLRSVTKDEAHYEAALRAIREYHGADTND